MTQKEVINDLKEFPFFQSALAEYKTRNVGNQLNTALFNKLYIEHKVKYSIDHPWDEDEQYLASNTLFMYYWDATEQENLPQKEKDKIVDKIFARALKESLKKNGIEVKRVDKKSASTKKQMKQLVEKAKGVKVFVDGIEFK